VDVRYHPLFDRWLGMLATGDEEVFGDVMALMIALETYGRSLATNVERNRIRSSHLASTFTRSDGLRPRSRLHMR
jgi:hypothetical protein